MALDGLLPQQLGRTNKAGAPFYAQLVSTIVIQILVIVFFLNETTYNSMVQLATMMYMLPYFSPRFTCCSSPFVGAASHTLVLARISTTPALRFPRR